MESPTVDLDRRYWVFVMTQYYPSGGLSDIKATFESKKEAIHYAKEHDKTKYDWVEILDVNHRKTIDV